MRVIKFLLTFLVFGLFLYAQDTPVNLESESISHEEIQLNWNVWDPADSYYDVIIYVSNIQDNNDGTIVMDFYLENSIQFSSFNFSIESDVFLSNVSISGGITEANGWLLQHIHNELGNFTISGENNGDVMPTTFGTFFQLTANYDPEHGDESEFTLNYNESTFLSSGGNELTIRWKNIVWEVGTGLANDFCGDGICTVNENYSICPSECLQNVEYNISRLYPEEVFTSTVNNELFVNNSFDGINMYPLIEYCFEVEAIDLNSGVTEVSNIACSTTLCEEINWYQDLDGDGYGNDDVMITSCQPLAGFVTNNTDENDNSYCLSNEFGFCGICNGLNECITSDVGSWCPCPNGQDDQCWVGDDIDCYGTCFGSAEFDDCGECAGGDTFNDYNNSQDCNGTCAPTDSLSLLNCDGLLGFNPSQPSEEDDCLAYLESGGGVDKCGICGGNNSACFPYFEGPTNLLAQATNLQIGLSWDPVDLCDPYIYDCDWGEGPNLTEPTIANEMTRENEAFIDTKITIDQIDDDGQGTVSFYLNIQADIDIYMVRINIDVIDIYDTLSVFQNFPNLEDLAENDDDCFNGNQTCVQFGQPSSGILENDDYDFAAYTQTNGSATLQSFSGDFIDHELLQESTTLFKLDAIYDPETLLGKELYISHTLTIQTETDSLFILKNCDDVCEKANVRFNTSVWQVGFGLASVYSCGDGVCQEPFEEPGNDLLSPSLDTDEDSDYFGQIVPDGYPGACSTGLTEYFLGIGSIGDCIPPQYCGDGICQDINYCELVNGVQECGYTDGAPHEAPEETWEWCSADCYSCGNGDCDWTNYENYCDDDPNNSVPECSVNPIQYLSCSDESYYPEILNGIYGDCMEPIDVEYTVYRDNSSIINEESCLSNNGIWGGQCFTPLISTTNTQYTDLGLNYLENHCYFIKASQGELTTMNGMIDPENGALNTNIDGNSNISCDQTNPQIGELPVIRNIDDMPFDQGGYVKLTVQRSYSDDGTVDSLYQVFRRFESDSWTHVGSFPGNGEENYFFISPTIEDSIPNNPNYHYFKIYYRGYLDSSAFSNFPKYGYSVDNISPQAPSGVSVDLGIDEIILGWNPVLENDFSHYSVYRNGNEVDVSSTHSYIDHNSTISGGFNFGELLQYQVAASDIHGNISMLSSSVMASYGNIGNVTFQDLFLLGENNLGGEIVDSILIDILDVNMAQSIACNQLTDCSNYSLLNPSDYEKWASDLTFDGEVALDDLSCLVYYIQNGYVCPSENVFLVSDFDKISKSIIFNVENIHSFEIHSSEKIEILQHDLPNNWAILYSKNRIYAYSLTAIKYSGEINLKIDNPNMINSIYIHSY